MTDHMQISRLPIEISMAPAGASQQAAQPWLPPVGAPLDDEVEDLITLLLEHATYPGVLAQHLARALAVACMGPNHLWQDLGLGNRDQLNALMQEHFSAMKALNKGNMRWKKFFYRSLCEKAEILICKSPHCEQCEDQPLCFDAE